MSSAGVSCGIFRRDGAAGAADEGKNVQNYTAAAQWDGEAWTATVNDPPSLAAAQVRGHDRTEVKDRVTNLLALLLGHRDFHVVVTFQEEVRG